MKKNLMMVLFAVAAITSFASVFSMDECIGDECYYGDDIVYMDDDMCDDGSCNYDDYY